MHSIRNTLAVAVALGPCHVAVAQTVIAADNSRITYTEFVDKTFTATPAPGRMSFSRELPSTMIHRFDSPGARANFATDADTVDITIHVAATATLPGHELFAVFINGVHTMTFGSNTIGTSTFNILNSTAAARDFSIVWPINADVDLVSLTLTNATNNDLLSPPPHRPCVRAAFFGDSITHGFNAPDITTSWPHQVGVNRSWQTINLGYANHVTKADDGGFVRAVDPDVVVLAIGTNDFNQQTSSTLTNFAAQYTGWIDKFCGGASAACEVPLICLTPLGRMQEVLQQSLPPQFFTLEQLRSTIRSIVRARSDPNIYVLEGLDMTPVNLTLLPDGLHPNGLGNATIANSLTPLNLARNAGFEVEIVPPIGFGSPFHRGYQWDLRGSAVTIAAARTGSFGLDLPAASEAEQEVLGLGAGQRFDLTAFAIGAASTDTGVIELEFQGATGAVLATPSTTIAGVVWTRFSLSGFAPDGAVRAILRFRRTGGTGSLFVDDASMPLSLPPALCEGCSSLNDAGTISITGGTGQIGKSLEFHVGTTTGLQPLLAYISASLVSTTSCGVVSPGIGMQPGTPGEILIGMPVVNYFEPTIGSGPNWPVTVPILNDIQLVGRQMFFQGSLVFPTHIGATDALRVVILPQ